MMQLLPAITTEGFMSKEEGILTKKLEVANKFFKLLYQGYCLGKIPTVREVAKESNVSNSFAGRIINEIKILGDVIEPSMLVSFHKTKNKCGEGGMKLNLRERKYILQLRKERTDRPNFNYTKKLYKRFGKLVCSKTITNFLDQKENLCLKVLFVSQTMFQLTSSLIKIF